MSPGHFRTIGIPVLAGELCCNQPLDQTGASPTREIMVNRRFADRYFPGEPAVGRSRSLQLGSELGGVVLMLRIVGIVGDARDLDREPAPTVYQLLDTGWRAALTQDPREMDHQLQCWRGRMVRSVQGFPTDHSARRANCA